MALAVAALAGCPAGGDDAMPDSGVGATHLVVTWDTAPPAPGPITSAVIVDELHVQFSSLRLIGDAGPGDSRTSRGSVEFEWSDGEGPLAIDFATAPPGLYSQIELGAGGDAEAFSIHGRVDRGGSLVPFEIEDEASNPVSLALAIDLRAGATATVPLAIELAGVVAEVPFAELPIVLGKITLRRNDPEMVAVRAAMARAVTVAGVSVR